MRLNLLKHQATFQTKFVLFLKKNKADDGKNETFLTLIKSLVKKPAQSVLILTMFVNW